MPLSIERNDLASMEVDAIVVAANEHLVIDGGVGLSVAEKAGLEDVQAACDAIGRCPTGSAVATPGFALGAKVIVHAVGPVWEGGSAGEEALLRSAYAAALELAFGSGAESVALPLISSGVRGFPPGIALAVARDAIRTFLDGHEMDVRLVLYDRESFTAGIASYSEIAEYIDDRYVGTHLDRERLGRGARRDAGSAAGRRARGRHEIAAAADAPAGFRSVQGDGSDEFAEFGMAFEDAAAELPAEQPAPQSAMRAASKSMPKGAAPPAAQPQEAAPAPGLSDLLDRLDEPFSTTLLALIDARGLTDAQVYKRANMSRQLFSKIRGNASYRPTKKTVLALAVALGLDLDETDDLLQRAGYALSPASKADVIVEYFISKGNHDIFEINEALYAFDQPLL